MHDFGFRQEAVENGKPHDYYIPENIFYRLCMKAKNEVAEKFQAKVADEIIPIHSHYVIPCGNSRTDNVKILTY